MADNERYFNFPISLLQGFLVNKKKVLMDIINYCHYALIQKYGFGDDEQQVKDAAKYFMINPEVIDLEEGERLYREANSPVKTGINRDLLVEYAEEEKTEFELVSLLGFLAIKSVLHKQPCFKLTSNFWLARMDGKARTIKSTDQLSPELQKYANRYQTEKIKTELQLNWNLKQYGQYTRGFYVSFSMPLVDLITYAEKRRESRLKKDLKDEQKKAIKRAMAKLRNK